MKQEKLNQITELFQVCHKLSNDKNREKLFLSVWKKGFENKAYDLLVNEFVGSEKKIQAEGKGWNLGCKIIHEDNSTGNIDKKFLSSLVQGENIEQLSLSAFDRLIPLLWHRDMRKEILLIDKCLANKKVNEEDQDTVYDLQIYTNAYLKRWNKFKALYLQNRRATIDAGYIDHPIYWMMHVYEFKFSRDEIKKLLDVATIISLDNVKTVDVYERHILDYVKDYFTHKLFDDGLKVYRKYSKTFIPRRNLYTQYLDLAELLLNNKREMKEFLSLTPSGAIKDEILSQVASYALDDQAYADAIYFYRQFSDRDQLHNDLIIRIVQYRMPESAALYIINSLNFNPHNISVAQWMLDYMLESPLYNRGQYHLHTKAFEYAACYLINKAKFREAFDMIENNIPEYEMEGTPKLLLGLEYVNDGPLYNFLIFTRKQKDFKKVLSCILCGPKTLANYINEKQKKPIPHITKWCGKYTPKTPPESSKPCKSKHKQDKQPKVSAKTIAENDLTTNMTTLVDEDKLGDAITLFKQREKILR